MKPDRQHLPSDAKERKTIPLWSGLFKYFPDALVEVARLSYIGNLQHNPGQALHWAREKSIDQEDTLLRHLLDSGSVDTDGVRHSTKVAWRALAKLQLELEAATANDGELVRQGVQRELDSFGGTLQFDPVNGGPQDTSFRDPDQGVLFPDWESSNGWRFYSASHK